MATLPLADRQRIKRGMVRYFSRLRKLLLLNDTDFQAAVGAAGTVILAAWDVDEINDPTQTAGG